MQVNDELQYPTMLDLTPYTLHGIAQVCLLSVLCVVSFCLLIVGVVQLDSKRKAEEAAQKLAQTPGEEEGEPGEVTLVSAVSLEAAMTFVCVCL